jgi:D-alanine-D-alanine ligase-like ATP-grasp enzyme
MDKKTVGILRGGPEGDYYTSLREGGEILSHIFENLNERWKAVDIFIDRDGVWHLNGFPIEPTILPEKIDLVWNTAHHNLVNILNELSIPTINISALNSLLRNDSEVLAEHVKSFDLKIPQKIILPSYQADFNPRYAEGSGEASGPKDLYVKRKAKEVLSKFSAPWIVKSFTPDSSMAIHLVKTFPELIRILENIMRIQESPDVKSGSRPERRDILVEEFIYGRNIDTHSVGGFRGEDIYVFPPQNVNKEEKEIIIQMAHDLHKHLGVEHYLKSTFVIHPKRGVFITEMSFSPDLKQDSHFHQVCESVGAKTHHIIEHILKRSLN